MKNILLAVAIALGSFTVPNVVTTASAQSIVIDEGGVRVRDRDRDYRHHRRDYRESRREREWRRHHREERRIRAERRRDREVCRYETRRYETRSGRLVTERVRVCRR